MGRGERDLKAATPGLSIDRIGPDRLSEYCAVPSLVDVRSVLQVKELDGGFGGLALEEVPEPVPWIKDYDAYGETPADWSKEFDISQWCIFLATVDGTPVGGACLALRTPAVRMLEGRSDMAVLWDIRVAPKYRRQGIGRALFEASRQWCYEQSMKTLKIETQNINVPACRFYASQGAQLGAINRFAYRDAAWSHPDVGDEVMLLWYLQL